MSPLEAGRWGDEGKEKQWLKTVNVPKQNTGIETVWRKLSAGSLEWTASLSWFQNIRLGRRWEQMFVIDRNLAHGSWHHENKNYRRTMWGENKIENHTSLLGWSFSITSFSQSGHNTGHIWEQEKSHQGGSPVPSCSSGHSDSHWHLFPVHQCIPRETLQADAQLGTQDVPGIAPSGYAY